MIAWHLYLLHEVIFIVYNRLTFIFTVYNRLTFIFTMNHLPRLFYMFYKQKGILCLGTFPCKACWVLKYTWRTWRRFQIKLCFVRAGNISGGREQGEGKERNRPCAELLEISNRNRTTHTDKQLIVPLVAVARDLWTLTLGKDWLTTRSSPTLRIVCPQAFCKSEDTF